MPVRQANAEWRGTLREGDGTMRFNEYEGPYSFTSRFEEGEGTNPEELLGAAHAGCFSMALAGLLADAGYPPTRISTKARVHIDKIGDGFTVTRVELSTEAEVPGIDDTTFQQHAENAKRGCPISRALVGGPEIILDARLA